MRKWHGRSTAAAAAVALALGVAASARAEDVIRIGLIRDVRPARAAGYPYQTAELIEERINAGGGLKVGGRTYQLELVVRGWEFRNAELEWNTRNAMETTTRLIREDKVLAVLGPCGIPNCVPVADICNAHQTININYWATEAGITEGRPWVFTLRTSSEDQMSAMARFAKEDLKARTAAVIFKIDTVACRENSSAFREAFEKINGKRAVVAWESGLNQDFPGFENIKSREAVGGWETAAAQDFRVKLAAQLRNILHAKAAVLMIVADLAAAAGIARQMRALGYKGSILGGYPWSDYATPEIGPEERRALCEPLRGCYNYTADFDVDLATGAARDFVAAFQAKYGVVPDVREVLVWDGLNLLLQAIRNTGGLTGDLRKDQKAVRDQLAKTQGFPGLTGTISYAEGGGRPRKCVSILKVSGESGGRGVFELVRTVCP